MYHPAIDSDDEYVELYNPTADRVYLENSEGAWRLDGAVDYSFPTNTSIPAGGRLIVAGFDPLPTPFALKCLPCGIQRRSVNSRRRHSRSLVGQSFQ